MKLQSLRYLTASGLKNVWVNKFMTLASVGTLIACMSIIGMSIILSDNVDKALGSIEKENVVMVYFNDLNSVLYGSQAENFLAGDEDAASTFVDASKVSDDQYLVHNEAEARAVCEEISKLDNIESVEYISKEQGLDGVLASMNPAQAEYFTFLKDEANGNPLSDGARVTMSDLSLFGETLQKIESVQGVSSTQSHGDLAEKISAIKHGVTVAGTWIVSILIIIALVIVSNTIRVTMYNRKLEISIMKAVGATDSFIRLPFLVEGITIGVTSAVISTGLLYFIYKAVLETLKSALSIGQVIPFADFVLRLLILFIAIGVLSGIIGSVIMIGRYLKREGSEFSAL